MHRKHVKFRSADTVIKEIDCVTAKVNQHLITTKGRLHFWLIFELFLRCCANPRLRLRNYPSPWATTNAINTTATKAFIFFSLITLSEGSSNKTEDVVGSKLSETEFSFARSFIFWCLKIDFKSSLIMFVITLSACALLVLLYQTSLIAVLVSNRWWKRGLWRQFFNFYI